MTSYLLNLVVITSTLHNSLLLQVLSSVVFKVTIIHAFPTISPPTLSQSLAASSFQFLNIREVQFIVLGAFLWAICICFLNDFNGSHSSKSFFFFFFPIRDPLFSCCLTFLLQQKRYILELPYGEKKQADRKMFIKTK